MRIPELLAVSLLILSIHRAVLASDWSREVVYPTNHDPGEIWFSDNTHVFVEQLIREQQRRLERMTYPWLHR